ncbi:unnamed protein product (macronuclear) [Paramecium tetraurelia]|uniref:Uncharacterized protein n=1 Tax=Paramecium tetraurelia TaxID=5888 RepID=A0BWJ1_PARTE|nr:uncharacterized protein GSPATT00032760001 [Paramecium tetraurelia]CAK62908.1 unnamed protein product [Paramecium tetraurelia]|eukprot:XP_001430306.1 hypothetical protein (macronuclear) [Paramecium tetraurelia strain d4-2]
MGSCSSQKIHIPFSPSKQCQIAEVQAFPRMPWINKYLQQPLQRIILPYNPNSHEYQYNVEVEGVIFDEIAPPDFLDDDILEPIEGDD